MINLIGKKFGRLVVIQFANKNKSRKFLWLCECNCGNRTIVQDSNLKNGHTKSCGCLRREVVQQISFKNIQHGHNKGEKKTKIYYVWTSIIQRCTNPNNNQYKDYGGREIKIIVCDRWLNSFENFLEDMGKDWGPGLTIERKDNDKGYFKSNCCWATRKEQQRNKRNSLYIMYKGKIHLLIALCEKYNMPYQVVWKRIYKYSWSIEKALMTLVKKRKKGRICNGKRI